MSTCVTVCVYMCRWILDWQSGAPNVVQRWERVLWNKWLTCACVLSPASPLRTLTHPYETHESFRHPHKTTCGLKLGAFTKLALSIIYSENLSQVAMSITHSMGVCSQLWGVYADLSMLSDSASYSIASSSFFICRVCSHTSITYRNMPRSTHMTVELLKYLE